MPATSITTDLVTIADAEPGTVGNWTALGGGQAGLAEETDFAVQGQTSISKQVKQETKGMHADNGAAISFTVPQHVYTWLYATTPGATDIRANGGLRVTFGSDANNRREFYVNGSDNYRYGGWICYPVWPSSTADNLVGSSGQSRYFGGIMSNTVTVKGLNFGVDVIRYGTGIDATGGGAGFPVLTFDLISTENDLQANAWGVFQGTDSGAQLQGELRIGFDNFASVTNFLDSDRVIINPDKNPSDVANTKTRAIFTGITIRGNSTNATFNGCSFISLDSHDPGFIDCDTATNSANVTFDSCVFQDWGPIGLASTVTAEACKFTNCDNLIVNGGSVDNCTFNDCLPVQSQTGIENIQDCTFNGNPAQPKPAIVSNVSAGTYSLVGNTFNGYNAANGQTDSAILFTATTGTIVINVSGGAIPTYTSSGATIVMQSSSTLTLSGLQPNTEVRVYDTGTTTEVGGVENSGTTEAFAIATSAVDIVLHNLQYLNQRLTNVDTSSDLNLPVQQTIDRQYENPLI